MSAKAVKQSAPSRGAHAQQGVVESLQSEVSAEASPLLGLILTHAGKLAAVVVLFIAALGGYWFYQSNQEGERAAELAGLGKILVITDPDLRLERLEALIKTAPEQIRRSAWFSVLETASVLEDNEKLYQAWEEIGKMDAALKLPAALGMANALASGKKFGEALALLEEASAFPDSSESAELNIRIALLSELQGDYARATRACEAVIANPLLDPEEVRLWTQKKDELAAKTSAAPSGQTEPGQS